MCVLLPFLSHQQSLSNTHIKIPAITNLNLKCHLQPTPLDSWFDFTATGEIQMPLWESDGMGTQNYQTVILLTVIQYYK